MQGTETSFGKCKKKKKQQCEGGPRTDKKKGPGSNQKSGIQGSSSSLGCRNKWMVLLWGYAVSMDQLQDSLFSGSLLASQSKPWKKSLVQGKSLAHHLLARGRHVILAGRPTEATIRKKEFLQKKL